MDDDVLMYLIMFPLHMVAKMMGILMRLLGLSAKKALQNLREGDVISFDLPDGKRVTAKVIFHGNSVLLEPIAGNLNHVHHDLYTSAGMKNLLIRDQFDENVAAFVLKGGRWRSRPLQDGEKGRRMKNHNW